MFKLRRFLSKYKKQCILGPLLKLTEAIFELIIPLIMANIIDVGIKNSDNAYVIKMGLLIILLGALGLTFALTANYFAAQASQGFGTLLRNALFSHINKLSRAEIDLLGTPTLINRISNDVNQLQIGVAMTIRLFLRAPFLVIGATIMALSIDFKLAGIFLIASPFLAIAIYLIMSHSVPLFKTIQKHLDKISLIARENLTGVRVIRSFSNQNNEITRFNQASEAVKVQSLKAGKISALLNPFTYLIMNVAVIAIIWFGGKNVNVGTLSQGEIIALVNYMTQILFALIVVANLVVIFTKATASASRVNEVFNLNNSVIENTNEIQVPNENSFKIEFSDVSFSYRNSKEYSLSNISLKIKQGERIGIIGGTGSGKTTLVNLIPRFYDVSQGSILIDGIDVKSYCFKQLREQISIVPQKSVLFSGTIRENIQWGLKNATDIEIFEALEIAQAKEFVELLSDGLDTLIVQGGKNLSGGQKQRLAIARAIVSKPKILILDDSASALDFNTDLELRTALKTQIKETTVIIVSQRATTIKDSDIIVVLDDGETVGIGKHMELFAQCKTYRDICLSQLSSEEASHE